MPSCAEPTAETAARKEGGCAMTRRAAAVFAVALVLTCALVSILPDAVRVADFHRHGAAKPGARAEFERLLYRYSDFRDEPQPETLSFNRWDLGSAFSLIPKDEARQDVDFLFRVLKYGYGAYQFFGGDEVFLAAKEGILAEIEDFPGEDANPGQLAELLQRQLGFIQDGHFSIGDKKMCRRYGFFARFDMEFDECGGRFRQRHAPDRWATAVEGEDPSLWMKPSIDSDGEIFYCLGAVSDSDVDICVKLEWSDGSSESVQLELVDSARVRGPVYELRHVDGVPVAVNRSLTPRPDTMSELERLTRDARKLRKAPAVILDLRSHMGGNSSYALEWAREFSGADVCPASLNALLVTSTAGKLFENYLSYAGSDLFAAGTSPGPISVRLWQAAGADPDRTGWSLISITRSVRAKTDTLLVVLIDSYAVSAGEGFVRYVQQLENVVVVGTNTCGAMLAGNVGVFILPNSKIGLSCGTKISLCEDLVNPDGRGLMPDLWVHPDEALERAIKYIQAVQADGRNH